MCHFHSFPFAFPLTFPLKKLSVPEKFPEKANVPEIFPMDSGTVPDTGLQGTKQPINQNVAYDGE